MGQLYGQNDPQTHEWQDGVLWWCTVYKGAQEDKLPERQVGDAGRPRGRDLDREHEHGAGR